jgi:penicillin-binding protein 2
MRPLRAGPHHRVIKNVAAEAERFRRRSALAFVCVVLALAGLALWYFRLQVIEHHDYATRSEANRIKLQPVVPGRGLIYDRKGRILADNVPAYRLEVTPSEAGDPAKWLPSLRQVIELSDEDVEHFHEARRVSRGFKPIPLKLRVSEEEAARFAVDRWRYPGVELVSYLNRRYLYGELLSHVIGYVARVDEDDAKTLGPAEAALSHVGKTGLERYYDAQLRGQVGYDKVETNVEGRSLGLVGREPAVPGVDLRLSIDLDLQRAMVIAFGDRDGSAVAVDPRTGEVLAMVSLPSYDANLFVNGISHADYQRLTTDPSRPLFNRNVLGGGPPGSTIKPLVALAGLDSGLRTPEYRVFSTGEFRIPGQRRGYRDSSPGAGWTDLRRSISLSINYYYYQLAYQMGIARFAEHMRRYGFGERTGIDLAGENPGVVPSPQWKSGRTHEPWYPGETVIAGIGQGYWIATALQLARGTAAIADGGLLRRLHLVSARRDGYEAPWTALPQPAPRRITEHAAHLHAVQEGMVATIHGEGTATAMARGASYLMAGKTGTSQKISRKGNQSMDPRTLPYHLRHQALFVGYAPAENPTIAVAVVVEHGGYGGATAAPIARKIFDAWLTGRMPEPDPESTRPLPPGTLDGVPGSVAPVPLPVDAGAPDSAAPAMGRDNGRDPAQAARNAPVRAGGAGSTQRNGAAASVATTASRPNDSAEPAPRSPARSDESPPQAQPATPPEPRR